MKVSEMIKNLQEFMNEYGDLDCWYCIDDEGNGYHVVNYEPTLMFILKYNGEVISPEDAAWREEDPDSCDEICVVN